MYAMLHIVDSFHLFQHNAFLKRLSHCSKIQASELSLMKNHELTLISVMSSQNSLFTRFIIHKITDSYSFPFKSKNSNLPQCDTRELTNS